jgi:hypothetical protein
MLVRAILLTWQELDLTAYNERDLLRDFLKRLLRLAPFMTFEALDERTLRSELRRTVEESVQAFANA